MDDERRLRADTYAVLAALLGAPPSRDLLASLARIKMPRARDTDDISRAWQQLRRAAGADLALLAEEYHDLFIGRGRGQVVPYGSWHLTGFLMEQPLSDLRDDLRALGIAACARQKDPEDHIAALCESMALIIPAANVDDARERRFFARHLLPWAGKFFTELQAAKSARFYEPVGILGRAFMELESEYLNIRTHIQTH
ncbi:MAG: molecular chaperone TorD family protein [Gammaproteobacteria bacterium]